MEKHTPTFKKQHGVKLEKEFVNLEFAVYIVVRKLRLIYLHGGTEIIVKQ